MSESIKILNNIRTLRAQAREFSLETLCKFTQILQLPQNTKGGIARC